MKITSVTVTTLESSSRAAMHAVRPMDGMRRARWIRAAASIYEGPRGTLPQRLQIMRVQTDEGIEGVCTAGIAGSNEWRSVFLDQLRHVVVGQDPLQREKLYQMLHSPTCWLWTAPGWAGTFDNCLWDIAGKAMNQPVYNVIGKVRDRIPAYYNIGGRTMEEAADDARRAVAEGFPATKDHFYHSPRQNWEWLAAVREAAGPDIDCMHDSASVYNYEDAVKTGHLLEELDYLWFEEPLKDQYFTQLQALCKELDIPVLAPEEMMYDVDLQANYLISGACDMIRVNARHCTTSALKLAHLTELFGTTVEMNGVGGLFGLVHAHLLACVPNTSFYEHTPGGANEAAAEEAGMMNPTVPVDGWIAPPDGPGWGAEWDWDRVERNTVEVV